MEIQLKQRLIGAVVIFTLLIIFLPMVFDTDSEQEYVEQILQPPIPTVEDDNNLGIKTLPDISQNNIDKKSNIESSLLKTKNIDELIIPEHNISRKVSEDLDAELVETKSETKPDIKSKSKATARLEQKPGLKIEPKPEFKPVSKSVEKQNVIKNSNVKLKSNIESSSKPAVEQASSNQEIVFNVNKKRLESEIYAVKIGQYYSKKQAEEVKSSLLDIGLPAYIHTSSKSGNKNYTVYVGPELEIKYIRELAKRVAQETKYQPEVLIHDVNWVVD